MKRKELLAAIPTDLPNHNMAKMIQTTAGKVLMVIKPEDIFCGMGLQGEIRGVVHFTWKSGYWTYYPATGEWIRRAYRNIHWNAKLEEHGFDADSVAEAEKFEGEHYTGFVTVELLVRDYEENIDYKKWEGAMGRKQQRINRETAEAPELPEGFLRWCVQQVPRKLGKRQRHLHGKEYIQLFQKCEMGRYTERVFEVDYEVTKEGHWHQTTEIIRAFSEVAMGSWSQWYYGIVRGETGDGQRWWDRKANTLVNTCPKRMILYSKNLEELGIPEQITETLKSIHKRMDYGTLAVAAEENPELEILAKNGLQQLVCDACMNGYSREKNWKIIRKLDRGQLQKLAETDGGIYEAEMLGMHPEITRESLQTLQAFRDADRRETIKEASEGLNINHVLTLLEKTDSRSLDSIREYRDYLRMAEARGMKVTDEIVYRNKRWKYFHAKYVEEKEQHADEELNRKNGNISADYKENCEAFQACTDGYLFLVPRSAADIRVEGNLQHHCVGRAGYIEKMDRRESYIVFLRKSAEPEVPYYTIETDGYRVLQAYGAYDRKPDWETVNKLLQDWIKEVRRRKAQRETQRVAITG